MHLLAIYSLGTGIINEFCTELCSVVSMLAQNLDLIKSGTARRFARIPVYQTPDISDT